jgi:hypothetical protein
MSAGLGISRWAPQGATANASSSTTGPKAPKSDSTPFTHVNEASTQEAFHAHLKGLQQALKPNIVQQVAPTNKAFQERHLVSENKDFQERLNDLAAAATNKVEKTSTRDREIRFPITWVGLPGGSRHATSTSSNASTAHKVTMTSSTSRVLAQPLVTPQGPQLLMSTTNMDAIISLLGDAKLAMKDGKTRETQDSMTQEGVVKVLDGLNGQCNAFIDAIRDFQKGVGNAKELVDQMINYQEQVTAASRASSGQLITHLESLLESMEKSLGNTKVYIPAPSPTPVKTPMPVPVQTLPLVSVTNSVGQPSINGSPLKASSVAPSVASVAPSVASVAPSVTNKASSVTSKAASVMSKAPSVARSAAGVTASVGTGHGAIKREKLEDILESLAPLQVGAVVAAPTSQPQLNLDGR